MPVTYPSAIFRYMPWAALVFSVLLLATTSCAGGGRRDHSQMPAAATAEASPPTKALETEDLTGGDTPKLLESCQTLLDTGEVVEVRCDKGRLVEFRRERAEDEAVLDVVIGLLGQRFGELAESRSSARLQGVEVSLSWFRTESAPGEEGESQRAELTEAAMVSGVAVALDNPEQRFWGLACYQQTKAFDAAWCRQALAVAALAGGLAHVGAAPAPRPFGDGIVFGEGCAEEPQRVRCPSGEASVTRPQDGDPADLRKLTRARLHELASAEGVSIDSDHRPCWFRDRAATCELVAIKDDKSSETLSFVLVEPGDGSLVVCSFSGALGALLPDPCRQLLRFR